ncbi:Ribonucleoside-diphosphate reductase 1 subunit alpha [Entomobacter blattae]|uniref:Vitamin B12-dependent ribonucleotide reductase n=2 Tax=Entomobacter blattae TaxID=2762277 RepID=A0A7H1NUC5_9PROT|nr:Ribonucleoside-diphosphate reductase 1 subunit alpha [Entomobacter blattae]
MEEKINVLHVIKRNGDRVSYNEDKIKIAMGKAFSATKNIDVFRSAQYKTVLNELTSQVYQEVQGFIASHKDITVEQIQDIVERVLMKVGHFDVAKNYIIYRNNRAELRKPEKDQDSVSAFFSQFTVQNRNNESIHIEPDVFNRFVSLVAKGFPEVDLGLIKSESIKTFYNNIPEDDIIEGLILTTRAFIEKDPAYNFVAAGFLLNALYQEILGFFDRPALSVLEKVSFPYQDIFPLYLQAGVEAELISPKLLEFDIEKLQQSLHPERDALFGYLGLQTLYDRYLLNTDDKRFEAPQLFLMRVAMGLAINEGASKTEKAIEFYNLLSSFDYMASTPTLFNSGTLHQQLSSCYLTTVPDDLYEIFDSIRDNAMLSKFAGGLGNDWTPVRALGAFIKGTNGKSQGVIPFMKVANDTAVAVNQGGKRKGAVCAYLETWHLDIEEFLELRKNTGDERRRTHDMNIANWIPDLFMKRVVEEGSWTLFSPSDVPDLHDLYGRKFEERYAYYEQQAAEGKIRNFRVVEAVGLWRKMLSMVFETGHPWVVFKDPCNIRNPQQHVGVVHSSNLCTEITLNTSKDEIAVCNLGSINLANHIIGGVLDREKLKSTIRTAVRMLDNVIDINFYPVEKARNSNMRHRPVGLGIMGFHDALYLQNIPYDSPEAIEFSDMLMEQISYYAIEASADLAVEKGKYQTYEGSLWSKGILPIDSLAFLVEERSEEFVRVNYDTRLNWDLLRQKIKKTGMRNSNIMAIAPTATIANIVGVTQSIEPIYQNIYVKSNLSGEFYLINTHLVNALKKLGLWDETMISDLKYYDGSVQKIERVPAELKRLYKTAFEIDPEKIIDTAARRQKWIDQAQSLNIYLDHPSGKKLDAIYKQAWMSGLKSTYYLRTVGASSAEKITSVVEETTYEEAIVCSMDNGACEVCQ